jgi:hypothetical protein
MCQQDFENFETNKSRITLFFVKQTRVKVNSNLPFQKLCLVSTYETLDTIINIVLLYSFQTANLRVGVSVSEWPGLSWPLFFKQQNKKIKIKF